MKDNLNNSKCNINVVTDLSQRDKQEKIAAGTVTTDILTHLNINIETLPQKCQHILHQAAESQITLEIDQLDPICLSLQRSKHLSDELKEEYEILKLRQKNTELQKKIDRNNEFLEGLRRDLACSRSSLAAQNPNPESIQDHIRQMKQKVASYEESCEKAKMKFTKLSVPEGLLPQSLSQQVTTLLSLREEAAALQQRADDVIMAREARDTFNRLRR